MPAAVAQPARVPSVGHVGMARQRHGPGPAQCGMSASTQVPSLQGPVAPFVFRTLSLVLVVRCFLVCESVALETDSMPWLFCWLLGRGGNTCTPPREFPRPAFWSTHLPAQYVAPPRGPHADSSVRALRALRPVCNSVSLWHYAHLGCGVRLRAHLSFVFCSCLGRGSH